MVFGGPGRRLAGEAFFQGLGSLYLKSSDETAVATSGGTSPTGHIHHARPDDGEALNLVTPELLRLTLEGQLNRSGGPPGCGSTCPEGGALCAIQLHILMAVTYCHSVSQVTRCGVLRENSRVKRLTPRYAWDGPHPQAAT